MDLAFARLGHSSRDFLFVRRLCWPHLIALVLIALLPLLIFSVVMIVLFSRNQQKIHEEDLLHTASALALLIDRELQGSIRTLEALATSEHLDSGDLRSFYEQAKRVLNAQAGSESIMLADPVTQQQLLNLRLPFGSQLPKPGEPAIIQTVSETGHPRSLICFGLGFLKRT
ncbi:MAG: hypothetical protein HY695_04825 [Deltaproteobacteria bacterium]|nr:hypothetical protein [Deltaproteobacteria bacterium]